MQGSIFGHAIESVFPDTDFFRIGIGINPRQAAATAERLVADFGDGVGDDDARQAAAKRVSIISWLSVLYALNGRKVAMWILFRYEKVIFNVFNF